MMAEEFKSEGTLDMDSESRRLFNVRKVLKGKKPQFKRAEIGRASCRERV